MQKIKWADLFSACGSASGARKVRRRQNIIPAQKNGDIRTAFIVQNCRFKASKGSISCDWGAKKSKSYLQTVPEPLKDLRSSRADVQEALKSAGASDFDVWRKDITDEKIGRQSVF